MIEAIKKAKGGDASASSAYRERFQELLKWLYIEANPIPVKMALYWMGILESPEMRLPLMSLDEKFHGEFKACLKNLGKL
jgi:4-hydroxy-tetrahydrodipicolinate synthase